MRTLRRGFLGALLGGLLAARTNAKPRPQASPPPPRLRGSYARRTVLEMVRDLRVPKVWRRYPHA